MKGDNIPAATTGESEEAWITVLRTARDLETGQAKNQSLLLSLSLGLRPVSQLPVKLFIAWPTALYVTLQTHKRGSPWEVFRSSQTLVLNRGEST